MFLSDRGLWRTASARVRHFYEQIAITSNRFEWRPDMHILSSNPAPVAVLPRPPPGKKIFITPGLIARGAVKADR
jgi:hypothetical protein